MNPSTLQPVFRVRDLVRQARPLLLLILAAIVALSLAGCATRPAQLVEIRVPVPVECRVDKPKRPAMPTEQLQKAQALDRKVTALLAEIEIREGYEIKLHAALDVCTQPIEPAAK